MRRVVPAALTVGLLSVAGLVYAQQAPEPPVIDLAGPDGPVEVAPEETAPTDAIDEVLEEAPSTAGVVTAPDPQLAAQENLASLEIAAEAAEEIPPEALEPPPPPPPPLKRPRYAGATLMAVDKISAETLRFDVKVGTPIRFKNLVFNLRACETTATDEVIQDEIAYLEVSSAPVPVAGRPTPPARKVYGGWAFASSPALNPIEHPLYDAWLVECTGKPPRATPASEPGDKPRRRRARPARPANPAPQPEVAPAAIASTPAAPST